MQPYFFPYIGYYQLVAASDIIVFYDDVNFIKNGWINRNRILINGHPSYITLSLNGASSNKLINEINIIDKREKILRSIQITYEKSPYFNEAIKPITDTLLSSGQKISTIAAQSIKTILEYLGIKRKYLFSSRHFKETKGLKRAERLIAITKACDSRHYINAPGGRELYSKSYFKQKGIELSFLEPIIEPYPQNSDEFIPGLSIIDVIMNNDRKTVSEFLQNYKLDHE